MTQFISSSIWSHLSHRKRKWQRWYAPTHTHTPHVKKANMQISLVTAAVCHLPKQVNICIISANLCHHGYNNHWLPAPSCESFSRFMITSWILVLTWTCCSFTVTGSDHFLAALSSVASELLLKLHTTAAAAPFFCCFFSFTHPAVVTPPLTKRDRKTHWGLMNQLPARRPVCSSMWLLPSHHKESAILNHNDAFHYSEGVGFLPPF